MVSSYGPSEASSLGFSDSFSHKQPACSNIPDCGFKKPGNGLFFLACIASLVRSAYRFEYGIGSLAFLIKLQGGTCTTAKFDTPKVVNRRAMYLLHTGFGNYNVFDNCEDFALYCKTGLLISNQKAPPGRSGQVNDVVGAPVAAVLSYPLQRIISSSVGTATVRVSLYFLSRYANDIGVREDVIKVVVEERLFCSLAAKDRKNLPKSMNDMKFPFHLINQKLQLLCGKDAHKKLGGMQSHLVFFFSGFAEEP